MTVILMAYQTLYNSELSWEEFAGVFETVELAQAATDDDLAWYQEASGRWKTNDVGAGGGIRRSFYLLEIPMNSTRILSGDMTRLRK